MNTLQQTSSFHYLQAPVQRRKQFSLSFTLFIIVVYLVVGFISIVFFAAAFFFFHLIVQLNFFWSLISMFALYASMLVLILRITAHNAKRITDSSFTIDHSQNN